MTDEVRQRFATLEFTPTEFGGMRRTINGLQMTAIEDPIRRRLVLLCIYTGRRTVEEFHLKLSTDPDLQAIAAVVLAAIEYVQGHSPLPPNMISEDVW